MPLRIPQACFRVVFEKAVRRVAFKKLESLLITHALGHCNKSMDMVWNLSVFGLLCQVPEVYANLMVVMLQFNVYIFHFRCSVQRKLTLNRREIERAKISLHAQFFIKNDRKKLRRKARQFLYTQSV